jgi:hypothetical protein
MPQKERGSKVIMFNTKYVVAKETEILSLNTEEISLALSLIFLC